MTTTSDLPVLVMLSWLAVSLPANAGDWPQILGPHRNGIAQGERLPDRWPDDGPATLWSVPLGDGYAGPAVAGGTVVIHHREGARQQVDALDATTGKSIWKTEFPASYVGGIDPDKGPRCVPLIDQGRVYVYSPGAELRCLDLKTGQTVWHRNLIEDFGGRDADLGYFGAGSSPLLVGNKLLVTLGVRAGAAGLVAVSADNGQKLWKATEETASYASPIAISIGGEQLVVFVTKLNALIVEPDTGRVRSRWAFGQRGPTVNAATPVQFGDYLFLTSSYRIGAQLLRLKPAAPPGEMPTVVWANDDTLSSQYATPVYHEGYLYGTHGREDIGSVALRCVEAASGKVQWSEDDFGVTHVILAGDKLLLLSTDGRLVLADASPRAFRQLGQTRVAPGTTRALPALSNGQVFFRTSRDPNNRLYALQVGP